MQSLRFLALLLAVAPVGMGVAPALASSKGHPLTAKTARRTEMVRESVSAQLTGHKGATELIERGSASGTFKCTLTITIKLAYTRARITFYCGNLAGSGNTAFYVSGRTSYFHGALVITHGSGPYRHSAGSRLNITGTLHRGTYSLSGRVEGPLYV
jgi:hypothetical protein